MDCLLHSVGRGRDAGAEYAAVVGEPFGPAAVAVEVQHISRKTGVEAGEVATKAGVKRLVVTHVPPWHDAQTMLAEAQSAYDGPAELAVQGAVYEL